MQTLFIFHDSRCACFELHAFLKPSLTRSPEKLNSGAFSVSGSTFRSSKTRKIEPPKQALTLDQCFCKMTIRKDRCAEQCKDTSEEIISEEVISQGSEGEVEEQDGAQVRRSCEY